MPCSSPLACFQVLTCLHGALQAVDLKDPLLRVSVGLRLALHLEAANDDESAISVLNEVGLHATLLLIRPDLDWLPIYSSAMKPCSLH